MQKPTMYFSNFHTVEIHSGLSHIQVNVNGEQTIDRDLLDHAEVFKLVPTQFSYNSLAFGPHMVSIFKDFAERPLEDLVNSWLLSKFRYMITIDPRDMENPVIVHFVDDGVNSGGEHVFTFIKKVDHESATKAETILMPTYMRHLLNFTDYSAFDSIRDAKNDALEKGDAFMSFDHLGKFPSKKIIDLFVARLTKRVDNEIKKGLLQNHSNEHRILIQLRRRLGYPELKLGVLKSTGYGPNHAIIYLY